MRSRDPGLCVLIVYTHVVAVNAPPPSPPSSSTPEWLLSHQMYIFHFVINTRGLIGRGKHDIGGGGFQLAEITLLQQGHCRSPSTLVLWVARRVFIPPDFKAVVSLGLSPVRATVLADSCHHLLE